MERFSHITLSTTIATVFWCFLLGCDVDDDGGQPAAPAAPALSAEPKEETPQVVAVVNDREITADDVERRLQRIDEIYRLSRRPFDDGTRAKKREQVLQRLVDRELLREHIADAQIQIDDEKIEYEVQQRIERDFHSSEAFQRFLEAEQLSKRDFRDRVREKLAVDALLAQRVDAEPIAEEQLRDHFRRISRRHPAGARIHTSTVAIDWELGEAAEDREKWRQTVEEILREVDDADALIEHLNHPELTLQPTPSRWVEPRHLPPEAAAILFADAPPEESPYVIDRPHGFDIFWVHERRDPGLRDFDEVRDHLHDRARRSRLQREREQLLQQLRRDAQIDILLPNRPVIEAGGARD